MMLSSQKTITNIKPIFAENFLGAGISTGARETSKFSGEFRKLIAALSGNSKAPTPFLVPKIEIESFIKKSIADHRIKIESSEPKRAQTESEADVLNLIEDLLAEISLFTDSTGTALRFDLKSELLGKIFVQAKPNEVTPQISFEQKNHLLDGLFGKKPQGLLDSAGVMTIKPKDVPQKVNGKAAIDSVVSNKKDTIDVSKRSGHSSKLSLTQAVHEINKSVNEFSNSSKPHRFQLNIKSFGAIRVDIKNTKSEINVRVGVANNRAKEPLRRLLNDQFIGEKTVSGKKVTIDIETLKEEAVLSNSSKKSKPIVQSTKKTIVSNETQGKPIIENLLQREIKKNVAESGVLKNLTTKEHQTVSSEEELKHLIKTEDAELNRWLQKQLRPLLKQLTSKGIKVENIKVGVDTESSIRTNQSKGLKLNAETQPAPNISDSPGHEGSKEFSNNKEETLSGFNLSKEVAQEKNSIKEEGNNFTKQLTPLLKSVEYKTPELVTSPLMTSKVDLDSAEAGLMMNAKTRASDLSEMIQKISELSKSHLMMSGQKLSIEMEVNEVGRLVVDALRDVDKINLHIQVESNEARRLLESQLRPILEQLTKDGLDIGKLDVSVRDNRSENQGSTNPSNKNQSNWSEEHSLFDKKKQPKYLEQFLNSELNQNVVDNQTVEIWA